MTLMADPRRSGRTDTDRGERKNGGIIGLIDELEEISLSGGFNILLKGSFLSELLSVPFGQHLKLYAR